MKKWIFNSKLDQFDVFGQFAENNFINWGTDLKEVEKGDLVYIYIGAPVKKILIKARIQEIVINKDYESRKVVNGIGSKKRWVKLVSEKCFIGKKMKYLTYEKLKENGLNGSIQGQQSLTNNVSLNDYIEMIEG